MVDGAQSAHCDNLSMRKRAKMARFDEVSRDSDLQNYS
jgi:hypothetical protein